MFDLRPQNFVGQKTKSEKDCLKPEKQKQKKTDIKKQKKTTKQFRKIKDLIKKKEPRWFEGR